MCRSLFVCASERNSSYCGSGFVRVMVARSSATCRRAQPKKKKRWWCVEISPFPQTLNLPVDRLKLSCESVDGVWFVFLFCFFPCVWLFAECEYIHHQRRDIFQWVVSRLLARWRGWRQDELTVQPLCYKKNPRRDACCMQQADVPVLWQTHTHTNTHTHFRTRSDRQTDAPTHTHTHTHTCTHAQCRERRGVGG